MPSRSIDLPQGTLDLLILRTLSLEPLHGWAVSERIQQISRTSCVCSRDHSIPRCIAWSAAAGSKRAGAHPRTIAKQSFTSSPKPDGANSRSNRTHGRSDRSREPDPRNRLGDRVFLHDLIFRL